MEARRLHVISGSWFGSLMPFSLHAPRHIGMEEVGWWGDPRRWDYRHASMRRQAWRRLGGGETRVRGLYSRTLSSQLQTLTISVLMVQRPPHGGKLALPAAGESFGLPGRAYKLGLRRVPLDRLGGASYSSHSRCYKAVSHSGCYKPVQASLKVCGWSDQP